MRSTSTIAFFGPGDAAIGALMSEFSRDHDLRYLEVESMDGVRALLNRTLPACVILDARRDGTG